jgi:hypothetical protein
MAFDVRALELHGRHIWQRDSILRAIETIKAHELTALVLHETDLVQMVTYPRTYLDPYLDFGHSGGVAERVGDAFAQSRTEFCRFGGMP